MMGEARQRRLAREAGRPWKVDVPPEVSKSVPVVITSHEEVSDYLAERLRAATVGMPVVVDIEDPVKRAAIVRALQEGRSGPVTIMGRPSGASVLSQIPVGLLAGTIIGGVESLRPGRLRVRRPRRGR